MMHRIIQQKLAEPYRPEGEGWKLASFDGEIEGEANNYNIIYIPLLKNHSSQWNDPDYFYKLKKD